MLGRHTLILSSEQLFVAGILLLLLLLSLVLVKDKNLFSETERVNIAAGRLTQAA